MENQSKKPAVPPAKSTHDLAPSAKSDKPKRHKQRPQHEADELRLKVSRMRLQGLSWAEISTQLKTPISTCRDSYRAFAEDYHHMYLNKANSLMAEFHGSAELAWNAHFAAYVNSIPKGKDGKPIPGATGKVEFLKDGMQIRCATFDRIQSAGFLPKVKEKIELQGQTKFVLEIKEAKHGKQPDAPKAGVAGDAKAN